MRLSDFTTLTFDCYGTLIDWESGMIAQLSRLAARSARTLEKDEILEMHGRLETLHQRQTPARLYPDILATVYRRLAEEWRVAVSWQECRAYGESIGQWPAFADSKEALRYLSEHYELVILSNVDQDSFARSEERLGVRFDAVFTAEDIGSYKPDDCNFDYLLARLGERGVDESRSCTSPRAFFTITNRQRGTAWRPAGSTVATPRAATARPGTRARSRKWTSASPACRSWPTLTEPSWRPPTDESAVQG